MNIIDRYLQDNQVKAKKFQLLGVTAMLIASKYQDVAPPELKDFNYMTDQAYTDDHVRKMEYKVLSSLEFDLNFPTINTFLERNFEAFQGADGPTRQFCRYLMDCSFLSIETKRYLPSVIAISALLVTCRSF